MNKRQAKTTKVQYEELIAYVTAHRVLIHGRVKPTELNKCKILWEEFSLRMNSLGHAPQKTGPQWKKVFEEWKANTRRKSKSIVQQANQTGGKDAPTHKLNHLEEQLLDLISKSHLGDTFILHLNSNENQNVSPNENISSKPQNEDETLNMNMSSNVEIETETFPITMFPDVITVGTSSNIGTKKTHSAKLSSSSSKKNSVQMKDVAEIFNDAQKNKLEFANILKDTVSTIAETINNYSNILKESNEIKKKKLDLQETLGLMTAEIELTNAKANLIRAKLDMKNFLLTHTGFTDATDSDSE